MGWRFFGLIFQHSDGVQEMEDMWRSLERGWIYLIQTLEL